MQPLRSSTSRPTKCCPKHVWWWWNYSWYCLISDTVLEALFPVKTTPEHGEAAEVVWGRWWRGQRTAEASEGQPCGWQTTAGRVSTHHYSYSHFGDGYTSKDSSITNITSKAGVGIAWYSQWRQSHRNDGLLFLNSASTLHFYKRHKWPKSYLWVWSLFFIHGVWWKRSNIWSNGYVHT